MLDIFIPTLNRAHLHGRQTKRQRTLRRVPTILHKNITLVIDPDDYDLHKKDYKTLQHEFDINFAIVPKPNMGIAMTRHFIGDKLARNKFIMLDDDLKFFHRRVDSYKHLLPNTPKDTIAMFDELEVCLDEYAHASISPREGNNRKPQSSLLNKRYVRVLAYRRKEFLSVKHGRVQIMEDFDINLQLLRKGFANIVLFNFAQDQAKTQEYGGCSSYRTLELHEKSVKKLAELHPDFVTLRTKEGAFAGQGFGTRLEVTIRWEKAFASSKKLTLL